MLRQILLHNCVRDTMSHDEMIPAAVKAITDHFRDDPPDKKIQWINSCLHNLLSNGWSQVDLAVVEERVRSIFGLPKT